MSDQIKKQLDQLAEYQAQIDLVTIDKRAAIDSVLTPEIKAALDDIEAEFAGRVEEASAKIESLKAEIKDAVIAHGSTVKGCAMQAVYSKPRVSWDTKMLDGLAMVIPQVASARRTGEPSVSIRSNKYPTGE